MFGLYPKRFSRVLFRITYSDGVIRRQYYVEKICYITFLGIPLRDTKRIRIPIDETEIDKI